MTRHFHNSSVIVQFEWSIGSCDSRIIKEKGDGQHKEIVPKEGKQKTGHKRIV